MIEIKDKTFIGIDVSKAKLDIFNASTGEFLQIENDVPYFSVFARALARGNPVKM